MNNFYVKNGTKFIPTDKRNLDIHEMLPVGNYVVRFDSMSEQFFLDAVELFEFNSKRYGSNPRYTTRILDTFLKRTNSTGVLLVGEKGSGKSLLAKTVSIEAAQKYNIPTIIINESWHGDKFNQFIQDIDQPAVILFDEFEKVYNRDAQESLLTLLDGVFPTKKLFILTSNDKWAIDANMVNRPGRIFYYIEFFGLDNNFIREYCEDNLENTSYIEDICNLARMFTNFNFDMLKALVEEMNRYNESPKEALSLLNINPLIDKDKKEYTLLVYKDGEKIYSKNEFYVDVFEKFNVWFDMNEGENTNSNTLREVVCDDLRADNTVHIEVTPSDMTKMEGNKYTFKKDGFEIILIGTKAHSFDYKNLF